MHLAANNMSCGYLIDMTY